MDSVSDIVGRFGGQWAVDGSRWTVIGCRWTVVSCCWSVVGGKNVFTTAALEGGAWGGGEGKIQPLMDTDEH